MPFQLSPGVNVTEIDLTTVIPAVSTTEAAIGGVFRWGPVDKPLLIQNEDQLVNRFGKPTSANFETFFTAVNFLSYADALYVSRAHHSSGNNVLNSTASIQQGSIVVSSTAHGAANGDVVFGPGIPAGAIVANVNSLNEFELSIPADVTATAAVQIFDDNYSFNAIANTNAAQLSSQITKNEDDYITAEGNYDTDVQFVAKYPGELGNSLRISVCDSAAAFNGTTDLLTVDTANTLTANVVLTIGSNTATISVQNAAAGALVGDANSSAAVLASVVSTLTINDLIRAGNSSIGTQDLVISSIGAVTKSLTGSDETGVATVVVNFTDRYSLSSDFSSTNLQRFWGGASVVDKAPGQSSYQVASGNTAAQDELHVVVYDEDGKISGIPGTVLEVYQGLSRATDSKTLDGGNNYYKNVLNQSSRYVWYGHDISGAASATAALLASSSNLGAYSKSFIGGRDTKDESNISVGDVITAYDQYKSAEDIDISLVITGKSRGGSQGQQLGNYLVDNIAEARKDCVVFISPDRADVVNNTSGDIEQDVVAFRNACRSTSYAVMDSGYKYQYDKYNDVYRYVPLNGDTAGLTAYTADVNDAWWSPAGFNRGQIKNIVRLAWNPKKAERDVLYSNGVNPVVNFPGQGIVLFGDKTMLSKPSAFDRINVRRLFIVLEKAIATSAKFTLFEFNDPFTRASFVNLVTPFLRNVQGRRGITDFAVICDDTNNTGAVVDANEFVGDIYIKPARSINFIQLNFVAVRSGVEFSEVIGQF
jgi:phage tail sheath protein FI